MDSLHKFKDDIGRKISRHADAAKEGFGVYNEKSRPNSDKTAIAAAGVGAAATAVAFGFRAWKTNQDVQKANEELRAHVSVNDIVMLTVSFNNAFNCDILRVLDGAKWSWKRAEAETGDAKAGSAETEEGEEAGVEEYKGIPLEETQKVLAVAIWAANQYVPYKEDTPTTPTRPTVYNDKDSLTHRLITARRSSSAYSKATLSRDDETELEKLLGKTYFPIIRKLFRKDNAVERPKQRTPISEGG